MSCLAMNLDTWAVYSIRDTSVVDPHWLNTDPDPDWAFYLSADPDPWSQTNVDLDPGQTLNS